MILTNHFNPIKSSNLIKIRAEATSEPPVFSGNRLGVQLWHVLVAIVLWADVSESFTGNLIEKTLVKLFT